MKSLSAPFPKDIVVAAYRVAVSINCQNDTEIIAAALQEERDRKFGPPLMDGDEDKILVTKEYVDNCYSAYVQSQQAAKLWGSLRRMLIGYDLAHYLPPDERPLK